MTVTDLYPDPDEPQPAPIPPGVARAASAPRLSPVRTSSFDKPSEVTRRYMSMGFDPNQAYSLAQSPNLTETQVAESQKFTSLVERAMELRELDPTQQYDRWIESFTETERDDLRTLNVDFGPERKEAGFLGQALGVVGTVIGGAAELVDTATAGYAGQLGGAALQGFETAQEYFNDWWREKEYLVRERGWFRGFFWAYDDERERILEEGGLDDWRNGEEAFRPGTDDEILDIMGGDELMRDLAIRLASGWEDEDILTTMGYQPESTEYQAQFGALQQLKQSDELRAGVQWAESHKLSPGRAVANLLGLDGKGEGVSKAFTLVSGTTDASFLMLSDPTLAGGKILRGARLHRYMGFAKTGADEAWTATAKRIFDDDVFERMGRWAPDAAEKVNPLRPMRYFRSVRRAAREHDLSRQQIRLMIFIDHIMAGTKIGSAQPLAADTVRSVTGAAGPEATAAATRQLAAQGSLFTREGVDSVLTQYMNMEPSMRELVNNVTQRIASGDVFDLRSMLADMRNGTVMLDAIKSGAGRTRFLNGTAPEGLFVPHMTVAGTYRMQARLPMTQAVNWALDPTPWALRAGAEFEVDDFGAAEVWLNELMRRNRGGDQSHLDDFTDFYNALVGEGFDKGDMAVLLQRRMVHTLGGKVVGREDPVSDLARIIVRDGKVDTAAADEIRTVLRTFYPDDPKKADAAVRAFNKAGERYTARFGDDLWGEASYAETMLDDANLDAAVRGLSAETDLGWRTFQARFAKAAENAADEGLDLGEEMITRDDYALRVFRAVREGTDQRLGEDLTGLQAGIMDEAVGAEIRRLVDETPTVRLRTGEAVPLTRPAEYRELVAEMSERVLGYVFRESDEARRLGQQRDITNLLTQDPGIARFSLKARLNKAMEASLRRAARVPAKFMRVTTKVPYVNFYTHEGLENFERFLDYGVYGDVGRTIKGRFVNAETTAAKREAVFAAQRELFRAHGLLHDPAAQPFVEEVLRAQRQYYGGTKFQGRNVALLPQAHSAQAMRIFGLREIMPHVQRSKFMSVLSPRYGTLGRGWFNSDRNYFQMFNHWWRQYAIWRPALAPRVTLDENLSLIAREGFLGDSGFINRMRMHIKYRDLARRMQRGLRVTEREVGDVVPGATGIHLTRDEAAGLIGKIGTGEATMAERQLASHIDRELAYIVDQGLDLTEARIWDLPTEVRRDVFDRAEMDNLWAGRQRILEMDPSNYRTEGGKRWHQMADALMDRFGIVPDLNDKNFAHWADAMSELAMVPAVSQSLQGNVLNPGMYGSRGVTQTVNAHSVDLDDFGEITLVPTAEHAVGTPSDIHQRSGLLRGLQHASSDTYARRVVLPAIQMHLPTQAKGALRGSIDKWAYKTEMPTRVTLGDPFSPNVREGFLAPVVSKAVDRGDTVAFERARWLALDRDTQRAVRHRLRDGGTFTDEELDVMVEAVQKRASGTYRISPSSPLWVTDTAQLRRMIRNWETLTPNQRGALLIDDLPARPGVPGAALMDQRFSASGRFDIDPENGALLSRGVDGLLDEGMGDGTFGPGIDIVMPRRSARAGTTNEAITGGYRFAPYAKTFNLDAPVSFQPPKRQVSKFVQERVAVANTIKATAERLDTLLGTTWVTRLDSGDATAVKDFFASATDIARMQAAAGRTVEAEAALDAIRGMYRTFADDHGIYGFVSGTSYEEAGRVGRSLSFETTEEGAQIGESLPQIVPPSMIEDADSGAVFTIFDQRILEEAPAKEWSQQAWMEGSTAEGLSGQIDEWAEIVTGDRSALDSPLWRQRARETQVNSPYWRHTRQHDNASPANGYTDNLGPDEAIIHVPRRNASAPQNRDDQRWLENEMEQVATETIQGALVGSTNIDTAHKLLRGRAAAVGDDPSAWHLVEVRVPSRTLGDRQKMFFDDEAATRSMPADVDLGAEVSALAPARGGRLPREAGRDVARVARPFTGRDRDRLAMVDRGEVEAAMIGGRFGADDMDRVFLAIDNPAVLSRIGDEFLDNLRVDEANAELLATLGATDTGVDAMRMVGRDAQMLDTLAATQPELATQAALLSMAEHLGTTTFGARHLDDGASAALRANASELAGRTEVPAATWRRLADVADDNLPEWWTSTATARGARVSRSKSTAQVGDDMVEMQTPEFRGLFYGGAGDDAEPMYELLAEAQHTGPGRRLDDVVDNYQGKMPSKVIRPRMKVPDAPNKHQQMLNWGFDKIQHFVAELSRWPMFHHNFAKNFEAARTGRQALTTQAHMDARARLVNAIGEERLGHKVRNVRADVAPHLSGHNLSWSDEIRQAVDDGRLDFGDIPADLHEDYTAFLSVELHNRAHAAELALHRTMKEVAPFIDDHRVRSQAADMIDDVWPFFYATEQFAKRWANTAWVAPEGFRRLQLYYHGLKASGVIYTDDNGIDMIEYPMTGWLQSAIGNLLGAGGLTPDVNLVGRASRTLPGLEEPFRFTAAPAFTVPLTSLRTFMPDEMRMFEAGIGGRYLEGKSPLEQVLPSWATRFRRRNADEIAAITFIMANHPESVPGAPDANGNATPVTTRQVEMFKGQVRQVAQMLAVARGVTGFFGPTSPQVESDPDQLSDEFRQYLDAGMPYDIALGEFQRLNPNALAHTMVKTTSPSGAPANATDVTLAALVDGREFYDTYNLAGPWLLPNTADDDPFNQAAWAELVSVGYRSYKELDDWFDDFKFSQGASIYFPSQEAKNTAVDAAASPAEREAIRQAWRVWQDEFAGRHPIFMEQYLGQEGQMRRRAVRDEMRQALADPLAPEMDQNLNLALLLDGWDRLQQVVQDHITYSVDQRRATQDAFHDWVNQSTEGDPMTRGFYRRNMMQDLDLAVFEDDDEEVV